MFIHIKTGFVTISCLLVTLVLPSVSSGVPPVNQRQNQDPDFSKQSGCNTNTSSEWGYPWCIDNSRTMSSLDEGAKATGGNSSDTKQKPVLSFFFHRHGMRTPFVYFQGVGAPVDDSNLGKSLVFRFAWFSVSDNILEANGVIW